MTVLKSPSKRKIPASRVVLTWLAMTAIAVLLSLVAGERMRRGVFDSWQSLQPRDLSASDVRIVLIDDASIEAVGPWQWPRYFLARLVEQLSARGAKVIAFDILFPEHDRMGPEAFASLYPELTASAAEEIKQLEPMDTIFGTVIGRSPVILAHAGVEKAPADQPPLATATVTGPMPSAIDSWPAELAAIPELGDVALGHGLINVRPDSDGVIRSVPLVLWAGGAARAGFAAEIVRAVAPGDQIKSRASRILIGERSVPIDDNGRMRLHFGRFPASKIVSAGLLLGDSRELKPNLFSDKIVIIGVTAEGTSDIASTPIAAEEYGPVIQAQAVDSILRGGWLERPSWASTVEWAAAVIIAVLALGNATFGRANRVLLALLFVAAPIVSWFAFAEARLLLDPARPLLVGGGAAAGVALALFALARTEREQLREDLFQERLAAAETDGELQAARAIQLGMVPPRKRLERLDPRVDIDAMLEPAKSVGGDYFDALKIGDDCLGFAIADVTGKGVPAALFMAMSKALTSAALSRMKETPNVMAEAINAELLKDNSEAMSVTMVLGLLDLRTGDVQLICAGHEDPLLIDCEGGHERLALDGGPPFSISAFRYPLECITLRPGQTLVLVTDGVTEAQNASGALFGRDRDLSLAGEWSRSATSIIERIRDEVRSFEDGTDATDDLAVMAIRYLGHS